MKYKVYGIMTASILIGEYEAKSKTDALQQAEHDSEADWMPSLCYHCASEIDLGEVHETQVVKQT